MEDLAVTFWRHRRVFVTGATGLLGSHLVAELLRREAEVVCLVRDWVPDSEAVSAGRSRAAGWCGGSSRTT